MPVLETDFELPGQVGEVYHGKVGDVYRIDHELGELAVLVRSDRISAYDAVLHELVPDKGQVLNQMSAAMLAGTRDAVPNWFMSSPDPNVSIGRLTEPYEAEFIVRRYLLGTAYREVYAKGGRMLCDNTLPDGMKEFDPFPHALLTPTTKAAKGEKDVPITRQDIIDSGIATAREYDDMADRSFTLFQRGQAMVTERNLLLADTKYEFGKLPTGQIVLIDEVHTPDSSRYFYSEPYRAYLHGETTDRPEQQSKEYVREWLAAHGFTGQEGEEIPHMPPEFVDEVRARYVNLFEEVLGRPFESEEDKEPDDAVRLEKMEERIVAALRHLERAA